MPRPSSIAALIGAAILSVAAASTRVLGRSGAPAQLPNEAEVRRRRQPASVGSKIAAAIDMKGNIQNVQLPHFSSRLKSRRSLQASLQGDEETTAPCHLCHGPGVDAVLNPSVSPDYGNDELIYSPDGGNSTNALPPGLNCGGLDSFAASSFVEGSGYCAAWKSVLFQACCSNVTRPPFSRTQCATSVRSAVLEGYDAAVEPTLPPLDENEEEEVTEVHVFFEYYHTTSVSTVEGTAEIFFAYSMFWFDERLMWDPDAHGGCEGIGFRASNDAEKTEIWVPEFDLLNRVSGLQALPDAMAIVDYDGFVFWVRFGGVKAFCEFTGLQQFPYDTLGCEFTFGSTSFLPVKYVMIEIPEDDNVTVVGMNISNYESHFQEYTIIPDRATASYCEDDEESSCIALQFYWERATTYYEQLIVIPTIIFTILSFGMFLLDVRVGERLAFGVSLLLVIVANGILTAGTLPVCKEKLWVQTLTRASTYFVFLAQFESVLVAYLFFADKAEEEEEQEEAVRRTMAGKKATAESSPKDGEMEESCVEPTEERDQNNEMLSGGRKSEKSTDGFGNEMALNKMGSVLHSSVTSKTLKHLMQGRVPSDRWRLRTIRNMDRASLFLFPVGYIIFFSVMLARRDVWGA